jgi:hypothetical protein
LYLIGEVHLVRHPEEDSLARRMISFQYVEIPGPVIYQTCTLMLDEKRLAHVPAKRIINKQDTQARANSLVSSIAEKRGSPLQTI